MDDQGNRIDLLVNTIGSYDARKAEGITKAGTYIMDVEADGDWTVTVEQPRPSDAPGLPQTFTGTGRTVSPFFSLPSGLITVDMSHNGQANFVIWLLAKDGQQRDESLTTKDREVLQRMANEVDRIRVGENPRLCICNHPAAEHAFGEV